MKTVIVRADDLKPDDVIEQQFPMPDKGIVKWGYRSLRIIDTRRGILHTLAGAHEVIEVTALDLEQTTKKQIVRWTAATCTKYTINR